MAAKKQVKAVSVSNEPTEYTVLQKFRIFGAYVFKGETITLKPSQAQYFLITNRLEKRQVNNG